MVATIMMQQALAVRVQCTQECTQCPALAQPVADTLLHCRCAASALSRYTPTCNQTRTYTHRTPRCTRVRVRTGGRRKLNAHSRGHATFRRNQQMYASGVAGVAVSSHRRRSQAHVPRKCAHLETVQPLQLRFH